MCVHKAQEENKGLILPANTVRLNGQVFNLLAIQTIKRLPSTLLEEGNEFRAGPRVVVRCFRCHGHLLTRNRVIDVVGKAHIAVELYGPIFEDRHTLACVSYHC